MKKITKKSTLEEIGTLVCQHLNQSGIECFLSGGAVVSIYTENRYESYDLDFITYGDRKKIKILMEQLGFIQEKSRHFIHPHSKYFVEFPGNSMQIADEPIREFSERTIRGNTLKLLTPTDCIKDRLAAFIHWKDPQGLEQALMVASAQPFKAESIRNFCTNENSPSTFDLFLQKLKLQRIK